MIGMKLCVLTTGTTAHRMGGTEVHAETLAAEAARQGHEVRLLTCAHPRGLETERKDGYTVLYLPGTSHTMSRRDAPAWWAASAAKTAELHAAGQIDVVWAENFSGLAYAALPRAARAPVISVVNGPAVRGEIASNFNRVSTPGELLYFATRYAAQTVFYYIPRFRAMVRDSDLLAAVSNETAAALEAEFPGSGAKTRVIFNSADTAFFRPDGEARGAARAALGLALGQTAVLMSGVMHKQKGMRFGLKAFAAVAARFPGARLLLAGDGPERTILEAAAEATGLGGRVTFCGPRPNAAMPALYNAADIYLNPTMRTEGLPLVMVEAMACGLPCVVSKIGGNGSSIDEGVSGFFTAPGNTAQLAEKLALLLADEKLRAEFSKAARAKALACFSNEKAAGAYLAASAELAGVK